MVREPDLGRLTDKGVAAAAVGIAIIGLVGSEGRKCLTPWWGGAVLSGAGLEFFFIPGNGRLAQENEVENQCKKVVRTIGE